MSLCSSPVPMPEKRITFKKAVNGTVYVYYTVKAYRNKSGKPTSDEVAIGKKDSDSGLLIPNRRYFEIFAKPIPNSTNAEQTPAPLGVFDFGNSRTLMKITELSGLSEILAECFPDKWREMMACAFYMVCEGNVMLYLDDWLEVTDLPFPARTDNRRCSEMFASISHEERMLFFEKWIKRKVEQEYIAYDVTSISTNSRGIDMAEWGYNRDHESLPQINLGMYYGADSRIPVYYNIYSGSVADKSHLTFMLKSAESLGICKVKFVLDCGFVTENNVQMMNKDGFAFISLLPLSRIEAAKQVDTLGQDIRKSANRIARDSIYGAGFDFTLYGIKLKAHVFFDPDKQALDEKELYSHMDRLAKELKELGSKRAISKKYTDYFTVTNESEPSLNFEIDHEKVDCRLRRAGFFVLLSTDMSLSSEEVLRIYRGRDVIEKSFDQLKNELDFRRLRTHVSETTEGKAFVGFLALILRSYMLNKLKANSDTERITLGKALIELKKIKVFSMPDGRRIVTILTKKQRTVLDALGIDGDKLITSP